VFDSNARVTDPASGYWAGNGLQLTVDWDSMNVAPLELTVGSLHAQVTNMPAFIKGAQIQRVDGKDSGYSSIHWPGSDRVSNLQLQIGDKLATNLDSLPAQFDLSVANEQQFVWGDMPAAKYLTSGEDPVPWHDLRVRYDSVTDGGVAPGNLNAIIRLPTADIVLWDVAASLNVEYQSPDKSDGSTLPAFTITATGGPGALAGSASLLTNGTYVRITDVEKLSLDTRPAANQGSSNGLDVLFGDNGAVEAGFSDRSPSSYSLDDLRGGAFLLNHQKGWVQASAPNIEVTGQILLGKDHQHVELQATQSNLPGTFSIRYDVKGAKGLEVANAQAASLDHTNCQDIITVAGGTGGARFFLDSSAFAGTPEPKTYSCDNSAPKEHPPSDQKSVFDLTEVVAFAFNHQSNGDTLNQKWAIGPSGLLDIDSAPVLELYIVPCNGPICPSTSPTVDYVQVKDCGGGLGHLVAVNVKLDRSGEKGTSCWDPTSNSNHVHLETLGPNSPAANIQALNDFAHNPSGGFNA
jgi:hypothetical protein